MKDKLIYNKLVLVSSVFVSIAGIIAATVEIIANGGTFLYYLYVLCYYIGTFLFFTASFGVLLFVAINGLQLTITDRQKLLLAFTISGAFTLYLLFAPNKPHWVGGLELGSSDNLIFDVFVVIIGLITLVIAVISVFLHKKIVSLLQKD